MFSYIPNDFEDTRKIGELLYPTVEIYRMIISFYAQFKSVKDGRPERNAIETRQAQPESGQSRNFI